MINFYPNLSMYISKLKIVNFKCFKDTEITFDENFNLIIGENNSGKSTIFDALRLWQLAFHRFLKDRTPERKIRDSRKIRFQKF